MWLSMSNRLAIFGRALSLFLLAANILVLSASTGSAYGVNVYFPYLEPSTTATSPPVYLQAGTAGSSLIYANNTSAKVSAVAPRNWLSGWEKRVKLMIDNDDIDDSLASFPVLIYLSNSSGIYDDDVEFVFNELQSDANRKKIALTTSDGVTQCYTEIEKWDATNKQAWLWTKVPSLSCTADTILYLYYDKNQADNTNYVGDVGSTAAQNVWDSGFKGVWHLSEASGGVGAIRDSTSNGNDGTDYGSPTFSSTGMINSAISFDGFDDFINMSNSASLQFTSSLTIEGWINLDSFGAGSDVDTVLRKGEANPNNYQLAVHDQQLELMIEENDDAGLHSSSSLSAITWYYVVGSWNGTIRRVYLNGSEDGSGSKTGSIIPDARAIYIGGRSGTDLSDGIIDEVRASNTTRSAAWIKASFESARDNLLGFGPEQLPNYYPSNYTTVSGAWISGTLPTSVQTVDTNYFVVEGAGSATSTTAYNPSGYNLIGSTTLVSGTTADLVSNNAVYMTFRSYPSATSGQALYAHQENTTIGGSTYRLQRLTSADSSGTTLSADAGTLGRKLMAKFVHQLTGVSSIPASTWTIYYRASQGHGNVESHCNVDILIRMSNGTVRSTIATNAANSTTLTATTGWVTLSGTYSWATYNVVDQTDYLEIDHYRVVTTVKATYLVNLRIDDNTLPVADQTRTTNINLPSQYTSEAEFIGSSNTQPWYQLVWSVDSAWTTSSVTVTIQVYNYTADGYPNSGNGYNSYTSSATANTDETKNQTITVNPTQFRNATGYWRIKIKGVKSTTSKFDFKADWLEFKPSHYNEYSVSTEFTFSTTTNTPTQLNFTVVSQYDASGVSVAIQVWNYTASSYATSGEGYLSYSSSGSNETRLLSINTNPQHFTSGGNAKIRLAGVLSTTTQYQQKANQIKLDYSYDASSDYDYALKLVNQVSDPWKIRLRAYSQSNIARLNNCTIYFHNATDGTSGQIYIISGSFTQQTGPWYDLPSSPAERYIALTLEASSSETSYVYVYLDVLVPDKTTYIQYILTFEIT